MNTTEAKAPYITAIGRGNYLIDPDANRIEFLDNRWYKCADGTMVPSVTTFLDAWPKGAQYYDWLKRHGEDADTIVDEAGKRGSTVHNLTEALDKGDRVTMCAPDGSPLYKMSEWAMFERYVEFRNLIKPEIIAIERHMASKELGYAGTLDRVMRIGEDVWIIDLKTSNAVYEHHHLQTAAYLELYAEAEKMDAFAYTKVRRGILHLNAKTRSYGKGEAIQGPGWQLVEASNTHEEDLDLFEACRKLWHATNKNAKPKSISYQLTHKI